MFKLTNIFVISIFFTLSCTKNISTPHKDTCQKDTTQKDTTQKDTTQKDTMPICKIEKKVLIIGIDGTRVDALKAANTPNIDTLVANGAYTWDAFAGGNLGDSTQQPTVSGPGWSSIFTSVWINKHRVKDDSFSNTNFNNYPAFYSRIKEKFQNAYLSSIVRWAPINQYILSDADYKADGSDKIVLQLTLEHLKNENPTVLFVHFGNVDLAGHTYGFSPTVPEYLSAIAIVDGYIGEILKTIKERPNIKYESWLIILCTDHGGIKKSHGGQSPEERTVFIIACGGDIIKGETSPGPGIVAIPPTVFKHLKIEVDTSWGWEGKPFGY